MFSSLSIPSRRASCRLGAGLLCAAVAASAMAAALPDDVRFCIGTPDASAGEFGLVAEGYARFCDVFRNPVMYTVGASAPRDWPFVHPAPRDAWSGGRAYTFTIKYDSPREEETALALVIGMAGAHPVERSRVLVAVNRAELPAQTAPAGSANPIGDPTALGDCLTLVFPLPARAIAKGANTLAITLQDQSWIMYDYVALRAQAAPLPPQTPDLKTEFLAGPMANVAKIVYAERKLGPDGHWYANIGYYAETSPGAPSYFGDAIKDEKRVTYRPGGRLCILDVTTGQVTRLIDDPEGGVRDPVVHYDGRTILFSWRRGASEHYHMYRIAIDGSGLTQLTQGEYDDFEPCWIPDGGIVFVSTRAKRWVNCWVTQVATLHRCNADGSDVRALSANNEHDNTPWVLPDGRVLYQRWEYVDRSQVDYHHLWTMNPDGTGQMVFYGNQSPGVVMIDAKPIPESRRVVAIFSPGHGQREHDGALALVDPSTGPDDPGAARYVSRGSSYRDPWAFAENAFMAAVGPELVLMDGRGRTTRLLRLDEKEVRDGYECHEPRPVIARARERGIPDRTARAQPTGLLILADVHQGRAMQGVRQGEIKKLLVLETLPKPINYTGGMDPLTYGGSFALERVLGTVPVEPDGSAYVEVPALRGLVLVALDANDLAVKRMQSFLTVQPGEVTGCVGCHEQRTRSVIPSKGLMALCRPPSTIEPVADCPDVFDFPRDIQPVLDRLCIDCHGCEKTARGGPYAGKVALAGDRGPMFSHAYFTMTVKRLFSDGRNEPRSNYAPRTLGSGASRVLRMIDGSHHGATATPRERTLLRLWIEAGAPYPGTYAALGGGAIGGYAENAQVHVDHAWPTTKAGAAVIDARCAACHRDANVLPRSLSDERDISFWRFSLDDPRLKLSRHIVFNLSRPEKSLLVLAPLAAAVGGLDVCRRTAADPAVFADTNDAGYRALLAMVAAGKDYLAKITRFDMPEFTPPAPYVREMQRFGVLPKALEAGARIDPYATDQVYWRSLWPCAAEAPSAATQGRYFALKKYERTPLPVFDRVRKELPSPVYDDDPRLIAMYWKAWELAFRNFHEPAEGSGYVSQFIDAAFNQNIFQWDTCFLTMFCNWAHGLVPGICSLDNFYCKQYEDGEICREIDRATGRDFKEWVNRERAPLFSRWGWNEAGAGPVVYSGRTAPESPPHVTLDGLNHPIFAWAELESYRVTGDAKRLALVYEPLRKYHEALRTYLRQGNGLYMTDWASMDNSPRNPFLKGGGCGVDISAQMALFALQLAEIARIIGRDADAPEFEAEAHALAECVNRLMWDPERKFYFDLTREGARAPVKTIAAYWTLLAKVATPEQAAALVAELENPATFNRTHRVPTLAADQKGYDPRGGYWRGAVWAPTETMVIRGLENYGYRAQARALALHHLDCACRVFERTGTVWENYAPDALEPGTPAAKDFVGWSGIGPIMYLLQYAIGLAPNAPKNELVWTLTAGKRCGCERFRFAGKVVSLVAAPETSDAARMKITVTADGPFTLKVERDGRTHTFQIRAGNQELTVP